MKIYVEKIRLEKGMTMAELARKSGIAVSHIYNIENGLKMPSLRVICKLAKTLGVEPSELYSCDD